MIKTKRFNLKLTVREYNLIRKTAHFRKISKAQFIRQLLEDFITNSKLK